MKKKPSIGVVLFAWAVLLTALISLPSLFDPAGFTRFFHKPWGIVFYVASFPFLILEIILAINVLRLKEWARKWLVILTAFYALTVLMMPFVFDDATMIRDIELSLQETMETYTEKVPAEQQEEMVRMLERMPTFYVRAFEWIFTVGSLAFYLGTIFFFTRGKVKAQFAVGTAPAS